MPLCETDDRAMLIQHRKMMRGAIARILDDNGIETEDMAFILSVFDMDSELLGFEVFPPES